MQFQQLLPIGYSKQPPLKTFIVAKVKKELTEQTILLYKQKYFNYFYEYDYLKLIKSDKDRNYVYMLFSFPEDLEQMRYDFQIEEFISIQLPSIPPIHKEQKSIYDSFWNIIHPNYEYPHKIQKNIEEKMNYVLQTKLTKNKCLLFNTFINFEAEDESTTNTIRHCIFVVMEKLAQYNQAEIKNYKDSQYYAKDMILVIYQEPCIMCSMALIHSRIKEVYYYKKRDQEGGLNQELQINNMKQLNHKYQVFYCMQ